MDFIQNLEDAGCNADEATEIYRLYHTGRLQDAVKALRQHRCSLMAALHESQDRVDCLDYLVYQLEKELKEKN